MHKTPGIAPELRILREYSFEALIRQTPSSRVFRARRMSDGAPVVVKLAGGEHPTALSLARLRHEYEIVRSLSDVPNVVRAVALEKYGNGLALILEDAGERSVGTLIAAGSLDLKSRLDLALGMAGVLSAVHERRLIHKDIQPDHFLVAADGRTLTLIDFGNATRLSLEALPATGSFEGTLAYVSPEQTGRMNRSVDRRSDLYSLGVSLYELFTGVTPFVSEDPLELVHCHIAQLPKPPREVRPELPWMVSELVMKLLSKAAEGRYQDAQGLCVDLQTCFATLDGAGHIPEFMLGREDTSRELRIPQTLYGRAEQLATLHATFERAKRGGVEVLLVRGGSGTGKSALVNELNKTLVRQGTVAAGKFDQLSRNVPYAPIVHGCRQLVRGILTQPEERLRAWTDKLSHALGSNARLMLDLVPELEAVIGPRPAVAELAPAESQHRFEATFQRFLEVFASKEHTLVLFLDDLQWADAASLRLLHLIATNPNVGHALIVGAYRDSEVDSLHPLALALAAMRKAGATVHEIGLHSLELHDVAQLLSDTLHAPPHVVVSLAELTLRKTLGNPFFVGQFLRALHREGLVVFDPAARSWRWDAAGIDRAMVTDNVVDFMLAKLKELPEAARELLKLAACIGFEFDRESLCVISSQSRADVVNGLWEPLRLGLVVPLDENYRYAVDEDEARPRTLNAHYRFLHDRVQQTAYALIETAERQAVHLRIGRRLLSARAHEAGSDDLFLLVDHLNIGAPQITDAHEKKNLAELNLQAGLRARDAAAYAAARKLLTSCTAALGDAGWDTEYELSYRAHLAKAECDFLSACNDDAFRVLEVLEQRARGVLHRVAVRALKTIMLTTLNRLDESVACGVDALRLLGVDIPTDKDSMGPAVGAELGAVMAALGNRELDRLVELPMIEDPEKLAVLDLVFRLVPPAFQSDQTLMALIVCKAMSLMLAHGHAPASPHLYLMFSLVYGGATGEQRTAFAIAQVGTALNERLQGRSGAVSATHFVYATFISHWWRPLRESFAHFDRAIEAGIETGDLPHVGYAANYTVSYHYYGGEPFDELEARRRNVETLLVRNDDAIGALTVAMFGQVVANLRGQTLDREGLDTATFQEAELLRRIATNQTVRSTYLIAKLQVSYLHGAYRRALTYAQEAEAVAAYTRGSMMDVERVFYRALATAQVLRTASDDEREALLASLRSDEQALRAWASNAPHNTGHRHALVAAELACATGGFDSAIGLYENAIAGAREQGFIHHQAVANELCGLFHLQRGRSGIARFHLLEAGQGFRQWGAVAVADGLAARHPTLAPRAVITRGSLDQELDVASVMKAASAISREVELPALLRSLVQTCLESAGAETVALVLKEQQELVVAARSRVGEAPAVDTLDIEACGLVCPTIVRYVLHTARPSLLDDAVEDPTFGAADDVRRRQPRSVIAVPLLRAGSAMGVLYLENNRMPAAFGTERVRVLELLAVQAAISIDNARLYSVLTDKNVALARALEASQESARLKSEFVANTSHELRTPLNAIINIPAGLTERLSDRLAWQCAQCAATVLAPTESDSRAPSRCPYCSSEQLSETTLCSYRGTRQNAQRYLDIVRVNGEQLLCVINDLLDMSKLEAGKLRLDLAQVSLVEVARDVTSALGGLAESRGLSIRLVGETHDARIRGDRVRLRQVLTNLVENALKFSDTGNEVTIELEKPANDVVLRVRDQGVGIAPENHEKIFESFYQVEGSSTRRANGTGLGLTICRRLVELHGGSIRVESALGEGASFIVQLPQGGGLSHVA